MAKTTEAILISRERWERAQVPARCPEVLYDFGDGHYEYIGTWWGRPVYQKRGQIL